MQVESGRKKVFDDAPCLVTFYRRCSFLHFYTCKALVNTTGGVGVVMVNECGVFILSPNTAEIPSCSDKTALGLTDCGETQDQHIKSQVRY